MSSFKIEIELTPEEIDYIEDVWHYEAQDQETVEERLKYKIYYAIGHFIKWGKNDS